ncbi:MAG: hypothetical protein GWM98_18300 [Nitrospinaceae bacterium]|nr:hypothetical protein [Nitrospinaceae bacterium]
MEAFSPAQEARAILESQFLSLRLHAEQVGLRPENLVVTGGASVNAVILQTLSSVFGKDLYAAEKSDSASLGAAYRAVHGFQCHAAHDVVPFSETMASAPAYRKVASPDPSAADLYTQSLGFLNRLEKSVTNG